MRTSLIAPDLQDEIISMGRRLAELEAFMRAVEVAETQWVAGGISGDEAMQLVSAAWNSAR